MQILENVSLKNLNTFGIDAKARFYADVANVYDIVELLDKPALKEIPKLVLGGGSNILFTKDFEGVVIGNRLKGIQLVDEDESHYYVKTAAGEVWHELVCYCLENNYAGIENLSLIPGNAGAAPMQNIGAYGVELKEIFEELEAIDLADCKLRIFNHSECRFGYRESIFKHELRNRYMIVSVTLRLNKKPEFNTSYGAIEQELKSMGVHEPSIRAISKAVCNIRRSKLPDPAVIGNAGSFFKNPEIPFVMFENLKKEFPSIVAYPVHDAGKMKLAAGWLIEQCDWKGKTFGEIGVHKNQALVLVNYGGGKGKDIFDLSTQIIESVKNKFGVLLEREVNVI